VVIKTTNQMAFQTTDGTVHSAGWTTDRGSFRRANGERLPVRVLVTKCGVPATGSVVTGKVTCPNC
jgi:hypothetical protein